MALINLEQAKKHLKLSDSPHADDDLEMKLAQAEAIILEYLERSTDLTWTATMGAWTDDTVPGQVQAAILLQFGYLCRYRGDGMDDTKSENGDLPPGVRACLYRTRMPVLA